MRVRPVKDEMKKKEKTFAVQIRLNILCAQLQNDGSYQLFLYLLIYYIADIEYKNDRTKKMSQLSKVILFNKILMININLNSTIQPINNH
jgi:hypothetical protein